MVLYCIVSYCIFDSEGWLAYKAECEKTPSSKKYYVPSKQTPCYVVAGITTIIGNPGVVVDVDRMVVHSGIAADDTQVVADTNRAVVGPYQVVAGPYQVVAGPLRFAEGNIQY